MSSQTQAEARQAAPATWIAPLPTALTAPPAGVGYLASPQLDPAYEEHEFLLSGRANVYEYGPDEALLVKAADQPYTTRVLVRHPRDPARFSGVINVDFLHPELGAESVWTFGRDYIVREGNAYIQITTSREARNPLVTGPPQSAVTRLKAFDPVRYAPIDFDEGGMSWDIISQVGRLIRTDSPLNPLRAFPPKQVIAGGWSGAGAVTLFYINDGFHSRARMPDGSNLFDGYLVGEPSWYPRINSTVPQTDELPDLHPRQLVQPRDVPAISLYSMAVAGGRGRQGMGLGRLRPDSDAPDDRYRTYMVAGASHAGRMSLQSVPNISRGKMDYPISDFPLDHLFNLTLDHLARWARDAFTPPHAQPLEMNEDFSLKLDADRIPVGGVRSTTADVPTASHFPNSGSFSAVAFGAKVPFTAARLQELYGDEAGYVAKVVQRAEALIAEGWLLRADADELIAQAKAFRFPGA